MPNSEYIKYLNTLHNADARNENAYAESNQNNPLFKETKVIRDVGAFIEDKLQNADPHVLILTGHAGDGKTSLLLQVLNNFGALSGDVLKPYDNITLPNGKKCLYIKDFSELSEQERLEKIATSFSYTRNGDYVFLVANTGPLINSFGQFFKEATEDAQNKLINLIDSNSGKIEEIFGNKICAINVATIDNSTFVKPFLKNLIKSELWEKCKTCKCINICPILMNRSLIANNFERVSNFARMHYIWQQEHGKKLTIRQITAHISYTLTGGLDCQDILHFKGKKYDYIFANLFFGYVGYEVNRKSDKMKAFSEILENHYDQKKTKMDEIVLINQDYSSFPEEIRSTIEENGARENYSSRWLAAVRRIYFLANIETDEDVNIRLTKDVFSEWFPRYLDLRGGSIVNGNDRNLIIDALSMIFTGSIQKKDNDIQITLKRDTGITQSVQLVYDIISKRTVQLRTVDSSKYSLGKGLQCYEIQLIVNKGKVDYPITLPLFNYFEDVRNGIIPTNIDPQLSHGVDSIKAQILSFFNDCDEDHFEMIVMKANGWESIQASSQDGKWTIQ